MMIKELLDTRIRPIVQEDGGDIVFMVIDFSDISIIPHGSWTKRVVLSRKYACFFNCRSRGIVIKSIFLFVRLAEVIQKLN